MQRWRLSCALVLSLLFVCFARGVAAAATVPYDVVSAVHGRVVGWGRTGSDWFVVYVDRKGGDWCGLHGASWRMALVETAKLPVRVVADRRIGGAMCGNELAWVRAGRFSDGGHREVAFMLWTTPAIGAWTYVYRVGGAKLILLARFAGRRGRLSLAHADLCVHHLPDGRVNPDVCRQNQLRVHVRVAREQPAPQLRLSMFCVAVPAVRR